jgi:NADH-quinone oxidoreductase subunit I
MAAMVSRIAQALKGAALLDFGKAFGLSLKYMAKPKATVNYPFERSPRSPRFRGEHALRRYPQRRGALHRLQAVRGDVPRRRRSPSRRSPARDGSRRTTRYDLDMVKCIYCGLCVEACPWTPSSRARTWSSPSRTREELLYDKERLLANGERWEPILANNLEQDARYL